MRTMCGRCGATARRWRRRRAGRSRGGSCGTQGCSRARSMPYLRAAGRLGGRCDMWRRQSRIGCGAGASARHTTSRRGDSICDGEQNGGRVGNEARRAERDAIVSAAVTGAAGEGEEGRRSARQGRAGDTAQGTGQAAGGRGGGAEVDGEGRADGDHARGNGRPAAAASRRRCRRSCGVGRTTGATRRAIARSWGLRTTGSGCCGQACGAGRGRRRDGGRGAGRRGSGGGGAGGGGAGAAQSPALATSCCCCCGLLCFDERRARSPTIQIRAATHAI